MGGRWDGGSPSLVAQLTDRCCSEQITGDWGLAEQLWGAHFWVAGPCPSEKTTFTSEHSSEEVTGLIIQGAKAFETHAARLKTLP